MSNESDVGAAKKENSKNLTMAVGLVTVFGVVYLLIQRFAKPAQSKRELKMEPFEMKEEKEILENVSSANLDKENYNKIFDKWEKHRVRKISLSCFKVLKQ